MDLVHNKCCVLCRGTLVKEKPFIEITRCVYGNLQKVVLCGDNCFIIFARMVDSYMFEPTLEKCNRGVFSKKSVPTTTEISSEDLMNIRELKISQNEKK